MIYRSWNTATKLAWNVPRSTFTFLVDRVLTGNIPSIRERLLTRYVVFLKSLATSNSKDIRILSSTARNDVKRTTGINFKNISRETNLDLETSSRQILRNSLAKPSVPKEEECTAPLLTRLLKERTNMKADT